MHECANPSATPGTRDISIPRLTKCCFTHVPMSHHLSLSVSPSLQYASNPPFLPRNLSFLYLGIRAHQRPIKSELLELPFWNGRPRYAADYPRQLESGLQVRCSIGSLHCCKGLRRSVGRLATVYQRQSLLHFFVVFSSLVLSLLLASFIIPISTCPIKHYSMGD